MAKQSGSPAQIEAFANRLTAACIKACKAQGTIGHATAVVQLDGDYSFTKEGELDLDLDVGAKIPDNIPVDADLGTDIGKERKKQGSGTITVSFRVSVRTQLPEVPNDE